MTDETPEAVPPAPRRRRSLVPTGVDPAAFRRRELAARVVELKCAGRTYLEISRELKMPSKMASRLFAEEMARVRRRADEAAEDAVLLQDMRIERMLKALDEQVSGGSTRAIEVAIKLLERQARLKGLDAPEKRQVEVRIADMPDEELLEHARRAGVNVEVLDGADAALPGEAPAMPVIDVTPEPPEKPGGPPQSGSESTQSQSE